MPLTDPLRLYADLTVLRRVVASSEVNNPLCRRFLEECDGERTTAEVAELLHLPQGTMIKVVTRCVEKGWGALGPVPFFAPFWQALETQLGNARALEIMLSIFKRAKRRQGASLATLLDEAMFAIEMALTPEEYDALAPAFTALQAQMSQA